MWSGTDVPRAWLSIPSFDRNTVHVSNSGEKQKTIGILMLAIAYRPWSRRRYATNYSETFSLCVIDVTIFSGSEWGHAGHYLRGVLGPLGQLGLWAPHVRSSCNLTDVQKGITKALGSSRRGSSFLFSSGRLLQSRRNFFFHTEMTK